MFRIYAKDLPSRHCNPFCSSGLSSFARVATKIPNSCLSRRPRMEGRTWTLRTEPRSSRLKTLKQKKPSQPHLARSVRPQWCWISKVAARAKRDHYDSSRLQILGTDEVSRSEQLFTTSIEKKLVAGSGEKGSETLTRCSEL